MDQGADRDDARRPRTIYYTATSLDGFLATEEHSLDWLLQFGNVPGGDYAEFIAGVGAIVMGANTYRWLLDHELFSPGGEPRPWPYEQPSWVFSSRAQRSVPGADLRFVSGDVAPVHRDMLAAARGKDVWIVGGGELAARFHDAGLLDEFNVTFAPATLGAGRPLFPRALGYPRLRLLGAREYGGVFVQACYEVVRGA